jgi:N-methylhydantoinase A
MERLINIDNGGTLTDIVVGSGTDFTFTKTHLRPSLGNHVRQTQPNIK